jgi:hypothetical protein
VIDAAERGLASTVDVDVWPAKMPGSALQSMPSRTDSWQLDASLTCRIDATPVGRRVVERFAFYKARSESG